MFHIRRKYPNAVDPKRVGKYPLEVFSGGGYFYDQVLEYRIWTKHGEKLECHSFATYQDAAEFRRRHKMKEKPIALVLQEEYIDEQEPGEYVHIARERLAEWQVEWLGEENKGSRTKIPAFLAAIERR